MIITIALILICALLIFKADKQFGPILNSKIKTVHVSLLIFTILITGLSLSTIFDIVLNFQNTFKTIYVQHGGYSPILNTIVVLGNTLLKVLIVFTTFRLAMCSNSARKLFITLIPILFIFSCMQVLNDLYVRGTTEVSIQGAMVLTTVILALLYAPLYFFYKNENVAKEIFVI